MWLDIPRRNQTPGNSCRKFKPIALAQRLNDPNEIKLNGPAASVKDLVKLS